MQVDPRLESGASIADFDGSAERRSGVLGRPAVRVFEEVHLAVLTPYEGTCRHRDQPAGLRGDANSARALRGEYSGVVRPGEHYLPLEKDFSNFDEVVAGLRDTRRLEEMSTRTYEDVVASGRYSHAAFIAEFDAIVRERAVSDRRAEQHAIHSRHALAVRELRAPPRERARAKAHALGTSAAATLYLALEEPAQRRLWRNARSTQRCSPVQRLAPSRFCSD